MSRDSDDSAEQPSSDVEANVEGNRPTPGMSRPSSDGSPGGRLWRGVDDEDSARSHAEREIAESDDGRHGGTQREALDKAEPFRPAKPATPTD